MKTKLHISSAHYNTTHIIIIFICRYLSISTPGKNDTVNFVRCLHKDGNWKCLDHNILGVLVSLNPWRHGAAASCCWCRLGPVTELRKPVLLLCPPPHTRHHRHRLTCPWRQNTVMRVVRWCGGAAAPSSSTAPQQDVCCGAVRGMALTPTLAVAPGLCSALAPLWPGPTSGHCGQCRAGIKWNEAHYVGLTRGSVQCLLVLSCCGVARCRPGAGWSTGAGPHHFSAELVGAVCTGAGLLALVPVEMVQHRTPECDTATPPPLLCSALSTHSAEYPHWSRWLGSSAAELAALAQWMARDTRHRHAGLGWAGLTTEIYKYFVQLPWVWPLAGGCWAEQETNRFGDIYPGSGPATTGHHWPPLAHVSTLARPPAPFTALFSSIRDQNRFQQWQAGVRSHCNVWTGSAAVYVGCNNMAMKYDHVLWVRLSNETRQYPVKCLFFCVFFESYLKSSNFIAGTSWVVSVVMPCAEFLLSPGRGPGSSSAQPAGRWGVRGQVRWTDTAPCHQPDCHCRSYFRNKRSPVTGLTRNCSLCVTEHQWMLGAAGLVTSPAQCPLLPVGPLAPWYHGARGPAFCWSDLLFCIDRAEPAQAQAAQAVRVQLFALIWTLRGEGRWGGGGPHWFLGTGSCYLSTVNCLKVILLLFRYQDLSDLLLCLSALHCSTDGCNVRTRIMTTAAPQTPGSRNKEYKSEIML